jgi:hypothetical protein
VAVAQPRRKNSLKKNRRLKNPPKLRLRKRRLKNPPKPRLRKKPKLRLKNLPSSKAVPTPSVV